MKLKHCLLTCLLLLSLSFLYSEDEKPFLALSVNISKALDQIPEQEKKAPQFIQILTLVTQLKLSSVDLILIQDTKNLLRPIVFAKLDNDAGNTALMKDPLISPYIVKKENFYKLNIDKIQAESKVTGKKISEKEMEYIKGVTIAINNGMLIAAKESETMAFLKNPLGIYEKYKLYGLQKLKDTKPLAAFLLDLPKEIKSDWSKEILNNDLAKTDIVKPLMGNIINVLGGMVDKIKPYQQFGISFNIDKNKKREITALQVMKKKDATDEIYKSFANQNKDKKSKDLLVSAIDFNAKNSIDVQLAQEGTMLIFNFKWNEADDKIVQKKVGEFAMSILFKNMGLGSGLKATEGEIVPRFRNTPNLKINYDIEKIKKEMPAMFKRHLHVWSYFSFGDKPRVSLQLEPMYLPMAELAKVKYTVLNIHDKNNKSIYDSKRKSFSSTLNLFSKFSATIGLNVFKGTKNTDLGTAELEFDIEYPTKISKVVFNKTDKEGTVKKSGQTEFVLKMINRDVCSVNVNSAKKLSLFAKDKNGNFLSSGSSSWSDTSMSVRFQGEIDQIIAVAAQEIATFKIPSKINLNDGKDIELPKTPVENPPLRYDLNLPSKFVNISVKELSDLKVKWKMNHKNKWIKDSLEISLGKGPISGMVNCESQFFGKDKPVSFKSYTGFRDKNKVAITLDKNELSKAHAVFGKIKFDLKTDIERVVFENLSPQTYEKVLKNGKKISMVYDKNQIIIIPNGLHILTISGFDKNNLRLKYNFGKFTKQGQSPYLFYGIPKRIELQIAGETLNHIQEFEDIRADINKEAYAGYKKKVKDEKKILAVLMTLNREFNWNKSRNPYGVASLYYVKDRFKKEKPISQELANSDPLGAKAFSYEAKPHMGYYFTCAKGTYLNGKKTPYELNTKEVVYKTDSSEIKAIPFKKGRTVIAIPAKKGEPAYFVQWSNIYRLDSYTGDEDAYIPKNTFNDKKWLRVNFISQKK